MSKDWGADDAYLLAKIAMAEAEGESTEGKALVICVVLNRMLHSDFPNTIEEVIMEKSVNNGRTVYQFSPVRPGGRWYTVEPDEDCYKAVEMVQMGWNESNGALYFVTEQNKDYWHSKNLEFLFDFGCHYFYK
jgi:N-acetylmuramoyl-L-alanine amidase